jgi:hypothetical protein
VVDVVDVDVDVVEVEVDVDVVEVVDVVVVHDPAAVITPSPNLTLHQSVPSE